MCGGTAAAACRQTIEAGGNRLEIDAAAPLGCVLSDPLRLRQIADELRDHPILLLPLDKRRELFAEHLSEAIASGMGGRDLSAIAVYLRGATS